MKSRTQRRQRGTSLIEVLVGAMFFIPIVLFSVDIVSLTVIEQMNDHLAKDAARAAANQQDVTHALEAAQKTVKMCQMSALITHVNLDVCNYDSDSVKTQVSMDVHVPAPLFGFGSKKLVAQSYQPVVGIPAAL